MEKKYKQIEYQNDYNKEHYKRYGLMISIKEKDVIEKLESVYSKNRYIIDLIKKDIEKSKKNV